MSNFGYYLFSHITSLSTLSPVEKQIRKISLKLSDLVGGFELTITVQRFDSKTPRPHSHTFQQLSAFVLHRVQVHTWRYIVRASLYPLSLSRPHSIFGGTVGIMCGLFMFRGLCCLSTDQTSIGEKIVSRFFIFFSLFLVFFYFYRVRMYPPRRRPPFPQKTRG